MCLNNFSKLFIVVLENLKSGAIWVLNIEDKIECFSLERDDLGSLTTDEKTLKEKLLLLFNV